MWLSLMKGGGISTRTNGLLTEGSSAALRASIRHAVVAGQLPRFNHGQLPGKLQSVPFKGKLFPPLIRIYPLARCSRPCLAEFRAACNHLETLCFRERRLRRGDFPHLERRKPARPEWDASSISGVTMRSIMSVSTVKVGTTMKSMNPGDTDMGGISSRCAMSNYLWLPHLWTVITPTCIWWISLECGLVAIKPLVLASQVI